MKINAVTKKRDAPSGWYRIGVLKPGLRERGVLINEVIPKISGYPPVVRWKRPAWLLMALLERISYISRLRGADATILQRELISTLPTVERFLPGKIILDVDDAIFLNKFGLAAKNAAKASVGVVCGNNYLSSYFMNYNSNVRVIPTGVDVVKMRVTSSRLEGSGKKIIGWIGTPANLPYFSSIVPALRAFFKDYASDVELRIVTSDVKAIPTALREVCSFVEWYPGVEFEELPKWAAGLMPLLDNEWVKGKCSFKMLQYMSAGIPVVVSPFGMNAEVLAKAEIGFGPVSGDDWYWALDRLIRDDELNLALGRKARQLAEKEFSLEVVINKWLKVFEDWL